MCGLEMLQLHCRRCGFHYHSAIGGLQKCFEALQEAELVRLGFKELGEMVCTQRTLWIDLPGELCPECETLVGAKGEPESS